MKKYLHKQEPATSKKLLQGQLDHFVEYYNTVRRTGCRRSSQVAYEARVKAGPRGPKIDAAGYRIRHDRVARGGSVTLRHKGTLHRHRGGPSPTRCGGRPYSP
jgi:hypothetical protein